MTRRGTTLWTAGLLVAVLTGCSQSGDGGTPAASSNDSGATQAPTASNSSAAPTSPLPGQSIAGPSGGVVQASAVQPLRRVDPVIVLHTSLGDLTVRLFESKAPRTVMNFLDYARVRHYDGTTFHNVESGVAAIGGAYDKDLQSKPVRYPIPNEAANGLKNVRGSLAMVHAADDPHSATAAFFINLGDNPKFDHRGTAADEFGYCVFGQVVDGLDVLDKLAAVPTSAADGFPHRPTTPVLINTIKPATMGVNTNVRSAKVDNRTSSREADDVQAKRYVDFGR